ncbi:MAG: T9SS type A sorting domain-containing protein, partial [Cytophagaceae bacterium]
AETSVNGTRPNANFVAITKELSDGGCASTVSYADIIDHFIISDEMAPAYVANSVTRITPGISNYSNTTTDHYPIYAKFNLAVALPVQLIDFRASVTGDKVSLAWETASERSASHFIVERSVDAREFTSIGQTAASGNTQVRKAYGLLDEQPLTGTSYYRLRTVDANGTSETSKLVAVTLDEVTTAMALTGNPVSNNQIQLAVRNMRGATFQLRSLTGQAIRMKTLQQTDRVVQLQIEQPLSAGVYLLEGNTASSRKVIKLMVD